MTVGIKPTLCLNCGKLLNRLGGAFDDKAVPVPGDISICFGCGHIAAYENPGTLRELEAEEMIEVMQDPEVQEALMLWRRVEWNKP